MPATVRIARQGDGKRMSEKGKPPSKWPEAAEGVGLELLRRLPAGQIAATVVALGILAALVLINVYGRPHLAISIGLLILLALVLYSLHTQQPSKGPPIVGGATSAIDAELELPSENAYSRELGEESRDA
jgi:hypothetical protein